MQGYGTPRRRHTMVPGATMFPHYGAIRALTLGLVIIQREPKKIIQAHIRALGV